MGLPVNIVPLEKEHWPWVEQETQALLCSDTMGFVALKERKPVAAVVLDSWSANSCMGHFVFRDHSAIRDLVNTAFDFVFRYSDRGIILGTTPSDNEPALRFIKKLGFKEIYRIRDGMSIGVDYVVSELRRENCKWLAVSERKAA